MEITARSDRCSEASVDLVYVLILRRSEKDLSASALVMGRYRLSQADSECSEKSQHHMNLKPKGGCRAQTSLLPKGLPSSQFTGKRR